MDYQPHPFADVWPMLDDNEFAKLKADIAAHGLRIPIVLYDKQILDGRNRYKACMELGITPRMEVIFGDEEYAIRINKSLNEYRRHLSVEQRAMAAARLANIPHGGDVRTEVAIATSVQNPLRSKEATARALAISTAAVADARAIQTHAPELEKLVVGGKMALRTGGDHARAKAKANGTLARITDTVKADVLRYAMTSMTHTDIATKLGIARSSVHKILIEAKSKRPPAAKVVVVERRARQLTPEQVDPEFVGSRMDFVDKYGHVQIETAQERATRRFGEWAIDIGWLGKLAADKQKTLGEVDDHWLRRPDLKDIARMKAALAVLKPMLERAEEMLAKAENNTCVTS